MIMTDKNIVIGILVTAMLALAACGSANSAGKTETAAEAKTETVVERSAPVSNTPAEKAPAETSAPKSKATETKAEKKPAETVKETQAEKEKKK